MLHRYTDEQVAEICHNVNTALQVIQEPMGGVQPSPPWMHEPPERRRVVIQAVRRARAGTTPREHHAEWVRAMTDLGWKPGPLDRAAKTHPNLKDYRDLDQYQRDKDRLFLAVVTALTIED
jgi:hypothetical protein